MAKLIFDIETKELFGGIKKKPIDLSISVIGAYNTDTKKYKAYTEEEFGDLWDALRNIDTLIGFNSNYFDIPIMQKYCPFDLSEFKSIDLLDDIRTSLGRRIKLDWIATATIGASKIGLGSDAPKLWEAGKIEELKKYCLNDVKLTKEIYEYALKHKKLFYKELGIKKPIFIDTKDWETSVKNTKNMLLF